MDVRVVGIEEVVDLHQAITVSDVVDIGVAKVVQGVRDGRQVFLISTCGDQHAVIE